MIKPFFKNIQGTIVAELESAQIEINVAVCWFTSKELFDVLCGKLEEKVSVNLIVLNDAINNRIEGLNFQKFIDLGGKFYFSDLEAPMHNKYCIIDNKVVINGSYNWTYFAENKNNENVTIISEEQEVVTHFLSDFRRLVIGCEPVSNVMVAANTDSQQITIVENARIASDKDLIIKSEKTFNDSDLTLKNSIGTSLKGDEFFVLIPKNSKLPIEKKDTLTTSSDNQTLCFGDIRFGESSIGTQNQQIGCFTTEEIPPMPKGKVKLDTIFSIDIYGVLTVTIRIRETGKATIHKFNIEHLIDSN